ncbi:MAG: hypothetical protein IT375_02740 [Polyangiaceae bacterium]|nr:hypothetical protein [Polyangiaceae bacterium]MCK6533902.1 hypothetical protein [Polyangiaceae bacterium]
MNTSDRPQRRATPPPLPQTIVTEHQDPEERISYVSEDDIEGGRVHVMYDRLKHDDYAGALLVAESILAREPGHHDAVQCREMCHTELRKLYLSRIGDLGRIPQLSVEPHELGHLLTDERAPRLLELVDGLTSLSIIIERAGMPALESLGLLSELFLRHVIEFEDE